jgi:protein required for attachment to host cells
MRLNSAQIGQSSIIWILVANGEDAKVYRYHKDRAAMPMHEPRKHPYYEEKERHELTTVPGMELKAESLDDFQDRHERRDLFIGGQNSAHNAPEPNLDIRDEVKQNLATAIATKLKQACADKNFDHLVIAASPKILGLLRQRLGIEVLDRVIAEIPKDFTHDKNHALLAHLQNTLTQAQVA